MASVRDVLNHVGRRVRLDRPGTAPTEGLGLLRGEEALLESKLAPQVGDALTTLDAGTRYRVVAVVAEEMHGRIDHYRVQVQPIAPPR